MKASCHDKCTALTPRNSMTNNTTLWMTPKLQPEFGLCATTPHTQATQILGNPATSTLPSPPLMHLPLLHLTLRYIYLYRLLRASSTPDKKVLPYHQHHTRLSSCLTQTCRYTPAFQSIPHQTLVAEPHPESELTGNFSDKRFYSSLELAVNYRVKGSS